MAALITGPPPMTADSPYPPLVFMGLALPLLRTRPWRTLGLRCAWLGGYWGWAPVEIAAFMPWLTGTAFYIR